MSIVTQRVTDGIKLLNTSNANGLLTTAPPSPTTLAAAITTTTQTAITLTSGTGVVNGAYIRVDPSGATEDMLVVSHSGGAVIVVRNPAVAVTHLISVSVALPGKLTYQLLPISSVPNAPLIVVKTTADINYVEVKADSGNTFQNGGSVIFLIDAAANSTMYLRFPAIGTVVIVLSAGGGQSSAGPPGPAGGSAVTTITTLTANATIASPGVPANGAMWAVQAMQDSTGGWAVTWGSGTDVLYGPLIDNITNSFRLTQCIVMFVGLGGKWYKFSELLGVLI